ncbi:hypothetical protein BC829DRAFT_441304 [Chytridium lagenaria]|nr:hypothetical protein BC829DRAFT_441304 [Chytridium lagenaria]
MSSPPTLRHRSYPAIKTTHNPDPVPLFVPLRVMAVRMIMLAVWVAVAWGYMGPPPALRRWWSGGK